MKRFLTIPLFALTSLASAAPFISKMYRNPDGADDNREFFEIQAAPGESLAGYSLLVIEGDPGSGTGVGSIERAFDLSGKSVGANGLYLFQYTLDDFVPAPSALTTIDRVNGGSFENGDNTFLLVKDYTGSYTNDATDLDTNNDGTLDVTPWSSVVDGFGITEEGQSSGILYASQLGLWSAPTNIGWQTTAYVRTGDGTRFVIDTDGAGMGPFTLEGSNFVTDTAGKSFDSSWTLTPGNINPAPVPEPASMLALGAGAVAVLRRRRRA